MSASMMVLVPLVGLFLVMALCFAGCVLPAYDVLGLTQYKETTAQNLTCVALWPLDDFNLTALDFGPNQFLGSYSGDVSLRQTGIVVGDVIEDVGRDACTGFYGGHVEVPFKPLLNPPPPFSIEAWVRPGWSANEASGPRVIVASADLNANNGFILHTTAEGVWAASVGVNNAPTKFLVAAPNPDPNHTIALGTTTYLVATYDGTTLRVFKDGLPYAQVSNPNDKVVFQPVQQTSPQSLFIGIAFGGQATALPFIGKMQDVAFYNVALSPKAILNHFYAGNGIFLKNT